MTDWRSLAWDQLKRQPQWDVVVIGGGATGLGTALESASRGYKTLLLEKEDFAKGTSSRSTKLVHGGVRYLEQFNVRLVLDALRERGYMLRNAPHIVHKRAFVVPLYSYFGIGYYGAGLKIYERMSGKLSFGSSEILSAAETANRLPGVKRQGMKAGVLYWDGQFDDARYAIALMRTFETHGGLALNYASVEELLRDKGKVSGVRVRDAEGGELLDIRARAVINATGVFAEPVIRMSDPKQQSVLSLSQGTHFVLGPEWLPGDHALMVPKTADGRVLFAIPWHEHVIIGTTDVPVRGTSNEPRALEEEIQYLRQHIALYFTRELKNADVLSIWSGMRPLVKAEKSSTSRLSRDHKILTSDSGLVTIIGGKWTTYRRMGEDVLDAVERSAALGSASSVTAEMRLHGWLEPAQLDALSESERVYGSEASAVRTLCAQLPGGEDLIHPSLPYRMGEVVWAVRYDKARTTEDVLARRTRALFLNARAAIQAAPRVSATIASELGWDDKRQALDLNQFLTLAEGYSYEIQD